MAVVQYQTRLKEPRRGLCSSWLASLDPEQGDRDSGGGQGLGLGPSIFQVCSRQSWAKTLVLQDSSCHFHPATGPVQVPLWARSGGLTFPQTPDTPVIMVGPGTGVAPFRAAVQERVAQGRTENFLFFGCRQRDQDFYWEAEWKELEERGCLRLVTAFSRDQERKVYVQHRLRELGPLVWELLDHRGASFYLAGNAKYMPADVSEALTSIFQEEGGLSAPEAAAYLASLQRTLRFQTETWA